MRTHTTLFAALNVALGLLGLLGAGVVAITLVFGGAVAGASDEGVASASMITVGFFVIGLVLTLSVPPLALGVLMLRRGWSRGIGLSAAIVDLLNFPAGTVLGGYGLWIAAQRHNISSS